MTYGWLLLVTAMAILLLLLAVPLKFSTACSQMDAVCSLLLTTILVAIGCWLLLLVARLRCCGCYCSCYFFQLATAVSCMHLATVVAACSLVVSNLNI